MSVRRENTFRIDYANVPKKPSFEELHDFVATELGLEYEQVVRLQPSRVLGCAFVKVVDLELAKRIVAEHDNKHETEVDGKTYKLRITLEDGAVEVKLTDLSEDISKEQIAEFLSDYGKVLSVTEQVWDSKYRFAGLPTGARIVRMVVKRNIESYVTIEGQTTSVSYTGQLQTCRHCCEFVHNGISCVQNKKLLVQKTYANVAKQTGSNPAPPKPTATMQKTPLVKPLGPKPGVWEKQRTNTPIKPSNTAQPALGALKMPVQKHVDPNQSKTNSAEQSASVMAPPAPVFSNIRLVTRQNVLGQNSDGNETDGSSTSSNSRRRGGRPSKKQRQNSGGDANEEIEMTN